MILVTGASGFAGTWLCRQLVAADRVVIGWVRKVPAAPVAGVRYRVQEIRHNSENLESSIQKG